MNRNLLKEINISLAGYFNAYLYVDCVGIGYICMQEEKFISSYMIANYNNRKIKKKQLQISIKDNKSEKNQSKLGKFAYGLPISYCACFFYTNSYSAINIIFTTN